jgi:hypothetical protein
MSRRNSADIPGAAGDTMRHALGQAGSLTTNTTAAARQKVIRSRAWAAPQLERTGQFLQQVAAPKLSAMLSSTARKIEPAQPRRRGRWTIGAGAAGLLAAVGGAAAYLRNRAKPAATKLAEETGDGATVEAESPQDVTGTEAEARQQDLSLTRDTAL